MSECRSSRNNSSVRKMKFSFWRLFCQLCLSSLISWSFALASSLKIDSVEKNANLSSYFARRLRHARAEIAKEYMKTEDLESVVALSYDVKWEKLESEPFKSSDATVVVSMFDKMFILEGNHTTSVDVKSASNDTGSAAPMRQAAFIRQGHPINFAKSIIWKSRLYLLVCDENECTLYIGENDSHLEHGQTVNHRGIFDATFFTRDNRLYLIVTHDKTDEFLGSSTIYHWTGTYMDIIQPIETIGDVLVTTFNYGRSTIIVFGKSSSDVVGLEIYTFNNNRIERIQYLSTNGPIFIIPYRHGRHDFLLVVNQQEASSVYWWDGSEFLHWLDLSDIVAPRRVNVIRLNDDTLFLVSSQHAVYLYKVTRFAYWRLDFLDLTDSGEKVMDMGVRVDEKEQLVTLLLVTFHPVTNLYRIEPWKLLITRNRNDHADKTPDTVDRTEQCLTKLQRKLEERMVIVENMARNVWPLLHGSEDDITHTGSLAVEELVLRSSVNNNDSMKIGRVEIASPQSESAVLSPSETKNITSSTVSSVLSLLNDSRKMLRVHGDNHLKGEVSVEGDAKFSEFETNLISTSSINGYRMKSGDFSLSAISATKNQTFSNIRLRGESINIEYLETDQLCGIPYEYWLRREDAEARNILYNIGDSLTTIRIEKDTVLVQGARNSQAITLRDLELRTIDGVDIADLVESLFIVGEKQRIHGNIFHESVEGTTLNMASLVAEKLNGISAPDLLTRTTEQNITGRVFLGERIVIKDIRTAKINGIPVEDFAMVSKKNRFTGNLALAKLIILDYLMIEDATKFPVFRPIQIYDTVTIYGNVKAKNVIVEGSTSVPLPSMKNIEEKYWTKSTNQTVKNQVCFDKGLSIDELKVDYLNDLDPNEDIILTTVEEINTELYSLEFEHLTTMRIAVESGNDEDFSSEISPQSLYEDSLDSLIINEEIRVERLSVTELYIEKFNGVTVDFITKESLENLTFPARAYEEFDAKFETLTVNTRLEVDNLYLQYVNDKRENDESANSEGRRKPVHDNYLRTDRDYTIHRLKSEKLILGDVIFGNASGSNNDDVTREDHCFSIKSQNESNYESSNDCSHLVIEGDATIEKDLEVSIINDQSSLMYLDDLTSNELVFDFNDKVIIDYLKIRQDLTLNFLRGTRFEAMYENTLSKSREQNLGDSRITFFNVFVDDLRVERINNRDINDLILIDSYKIQFPGDVVFTDLIVSSLDSPSTPDIRTKYFNGYSTLSNELYEKLGNISTELIENLTVRGNVFWQRGGNNSSGNLTKLETIMRHGLLRNHSTPCVIHTHDPRGTIIQSSTRTLVASIRSTGKKNSSEKRKINGIDMEDILQDAVLDDSSVYQRSNAIRIDGEKIFQNDVRCNRLIVSGEIDIRKLNRWNVDDLRSSVVRINPSVEGKSLFSTINTTVIFREGIKTRKLELKRRNNDSPLRIHGSPVSGVFTLGTENREESLPESTYFDHLSILNDASVESLDSVDFNDFVNDRVSLASPSKNPIIVYGNLQFNGLVRVTENARVNSINGIAPIDLVLNNSSENQVIQSSEILISGDLTINGETFAPLVAGINVKEAYDNTVLKDDHVEIFGDIIFQADVEKSLGPIRTSDPNAQVDAESPVGGFVNGVRLKNHMAERKISEANFFDDIARIANDLDVRIARISNIHLPEIFYYFEPEMSLMINDARGVTNLKATSVGDTTILSLYTNELASFCGLANDCHCRGQYVVEITGNGDDCRSWKVREPRIFHHFHEAKGAFAINIATNTVSQSERCTLFNETLHDSEKSFSEFTTISWMRNDQEILFLHRHPSTSGNAFASNVTKDAIKIYGYLSDAAVFTDNDLVFIVLAIYYDPILSTHRTNSVIYVLDLATNSLKLFQSIPTSYAVGVHVFRVPNRGPHLFFSSFARGIRTESVLYRLDTRAAQFQLMRSFPNGGNRHVKSASRSDEDFLILDDAGVNSIAIYRYEPKWDNFYLHQNIYHDSMAPVTSIDTFYTGEFRHNQVYVIVTTEHDQFFVYEYNFMGKFQLIGKKRMADIISVIPFDVGDDRYVFVGTEANSTILKIIDQGIAREEV